MQTFPQSIPDARAAAIVNVRMGSQRLPGKAMREVGGKPLLGYLLDRLRRATRVKTVVVATSTAPANDVIAAFCALGGVACFRGSEADVLERTLGALHSIDAEFAALVFGDGPLIDTAIVDRMIEAFFAMQPCDFVGNDLKTTFPPGMEVEVFAVRALADADRRCDDASMREHGTLFIRRNPDLYRISNVEAPPHLRRPDLSLEVDTEADFRVVKTILEHFGDRQDVPLEDIVRFLDERPEIAAINRNVPRRWKVFRQNGSSTEST